MYINILNYFFFTGLSFNDLGFEQADDRERMVNEINI